MCRDDFVEGGHVQGFLHHIKRKQCNLMSTFCTFLSSQIRNKIPIFPTLQWQSHLAMSPTANHSLNIAWPIQSQWSFQQNKWAFFRNLFYIPHKHLQPIFFSSSFSRHIIKIIFSFKDMAIRQNNLISVLKGNLDTTPHPCVIPK